jgi:WD40 repeat protein
LNPLLTKHPISFRLSRATQTLTGHLAPITALDFSEPYGVAVTASLDESVRLWDLTTGDEMGFLKGHRGAFVLDFRLSFSP